MAQHRMGRRRRLVGADPQHIATLAPRIQRRLDTRIGLRQTDRVLVSRDQIFGHARRPRGIFKTARRQHLPDQRRHAAPDKAADGGQIEAFQPLIGQHRIGSRVNIGRTVDQRPVEIENDDHRANAPSAASRIARIFAP